MIRLQDRPSKLFVCDGLDALLAFSKVQKRKYNIAKAELQKVKDLKAAAAASTGTSTNSDPVPPTSGTNSTTAPTTATATPVSVPVPLPSTLPTFQQGSSTGHASGVEASTQASTSQTAGGEQPVTEQTVNSSLPNPLSPSAPTQTPMMGLPFSLSRLFGNGLVPTPPSPPGPSLDDVD